jgi:hypothetical protein
MASASAEPNDYVFFTVFTNTESNTIPFELKLQIPIGDFAHYTRRPLKWLRYLGWAILGFDGDLSAETGGLIINNEKLATEELDESNRTFFFVPREGKPVCLVPVSIRV